MTAFHLTPGDDYCSNYLTSFKQDVTHNLRILVAESILTATSYLPYIVYFTIVTFMEPHDCFDCFNRIPVLRYSIFQFTIQERNSLREA